MTAPYASRVCRQHPTALGLLRHPLVLAVGLALDAILAYIVVQLAWTWFLSRLVVAGWL